jgi:toxin secretion/phage lysis holin
MEKLIKFCAVIFGIYYSILHASYIIFGVLIIMNIVDELTALLAESSMGNPISADIAFKGTIKKINRLFYIIVALSVDILITYQFSPENTITPVSGAVITWLAINEMISIISNISRNDKLNVPPMLVKFLEKFKGE